MGLWICNWLHRSSWRMYSAMFDHSWNIGVVVLQKVCREKQARPCFSCSTAITTALAVIQKGVACYCAHSMIIHSVCFISYIANTQTVGFMNRMTCHYIWSFLCSSWQVSCIGCSCCLNIKLYLFWSGCCGSLHTNMDWTVQSASWILCMLGVTHHSASIIQMHTAVRPCRGQLRSKRMIFLWLKFSKHLVTGSQRLETISVLGWTHNLCKICSCRPATARLCKNHQRWKWKHKTRQAVITPRSPPRLLGMQANVAVLTRIWNRRHKSTESCRKQV